MNSLVMKPVQNRIHPLDPASQSKIRSSTRISSLNDIVIELVKNALDAQAKSISAALNYVTGFCSVQDDGCGIPAEEFAEDGRLAEIYCTSKLNRPHILYGQYGRHLAAISGIALLSISSRHDDRRVHTLCVNDAGRLGHYEEEGSNWHARRGTRVKVYNLFAKFPVRRKHLAQYFASTNTIDGELGRLKHDLTGLIFAFPGNFDLDVRLANSRYAFRRKCVELSSDWQAKENVYKNPEEVTTILQQLGYIDRKQTSGWQSITVSSQTIHVQAVVSLTPSPHKLIQFISINQHPLKKQTHATLFDIVNSVFDLSTFGTPVLGKAPANELEQEVEVEYAGSKPAMEHKKGIEKWPMFVVWVDTRATDLNASGVNTISTEDFERLTSRVSLLLKTMVSEFLKNNGYKLMHKTKERTQHKPMGFLVEQSTFADNWSGHSPGDWSHIKASREFAMEDILSGLPFQCLRESQEELLDKGSTLQGKDQLAIPDLPYRCDKPTDFADENVVTWTDPVSRQTTFIDPRTGIVLPGSEAFPARNQSFAHRSKRHKTTPFARVAENAKKYCGLRNNNERPVRSIALFADPSEGLDDFRQADSKIERQFRQPSSTQTLEKGKSNVSKISRSALEKLLVLGQVDTKFILGIMPYLELSSPTSVATSCQLVLIDQHAADERVKVEQLIRCFFDKTITLASPIPFKTSAREAELLELHKSYFGDFHIVYNIATCDQDPTLDAFASAQSYEVHITHLPEVIAERCRLQPRIIVDLIREEIWSVVENAPTSRAMRAKMQNLYHTPEDILTRPRDITIASYLPSRILDLLNSRACRSAIMFNDELTHSQCTSLVRSLAECTLPFQCAHGRPSMVTLVDLSSFTVHDPLASNEVSLHDLGLGSSQTRGSSDRSHELNMVDDSQSFGHAYVNWMKKGQF